MLYNVAEIFGSIQGEGINLGRACTFIRLGGCNLTCPWCDSKETWDAADSKAMTIDEIVSQVSTRLVVITGGEPTMQDLVPLLTELNKMNCDIAIESNGTFDFTEEWRHLIKTITVSPKPPLYHIPLRVDEIKLVVDDTLTDETIERALIIKATSNKVISIWLQPEFFSFEKSVELATAWVEKYPRDLKLGIQAHKVWGLE